MDIVRNYLHLIKNEFYPGDERAFFSNAAFSLRRSLTPPNGSTNEAYFSRSRTIDSHFAKATQAFSRLLPPNSTSLISFGAL